MKALWLCSWYPNEQDPFRGDFIERQAIAAAAFVNIDVIHFVSAPFTKNMHVQVNDNLCTHIFYVAGKNKLQRYVHMLRILQQWVNNHFYDIVHIHIPMPMACLYRLIPALHTIPLLVSEHYGIYDIHQTDHYLKRSRLFRYCTSWVCQRAKHVITVSRYLQQGMQGMIPDIKSFVVLSNVVDTKLFSPSLPNPYPPFVFIHVSGMDDNKNVAGILQACALLVKQNCLFTLQLIGAKPPALVELANQLGVLDYIDWKDALPYAEVALHVKKAHVGLLFSSRETQSCVILEWLCAGLPVISSNAGATSELINSENGILVNEGQVHELANAMLCMMEKYQAYNREKIATQAHELYSYKTFGQQLQQIYRQCLVE